MFVGQPAYLPPASIHPSQNTFETVVADITHRCNMKCKNCYLPNRTIPDMDVRRLEDCLAQLPRRTTIRLVGAEPTLRSDLPEIIAMVRRLGHRVVLITNGLRLAKSSYVRELKDAGLRTVCISLNGADNDDWYEAIDSMRCATKKLAAVENVVENGLILNTGTILIRGLNEGAVGRIYKYVKGLGVRHASLRFKNVGAIGRYDNDAEARNLSLQEIEELCSDAIGWESEVLDQFNRFKSFVETNTRLFPADMRARSGSGIWFKLTDWQVSGGGCVDPNSARRGRITQDFQISPFFENVEQENSAQNFLEENAMALL